MLASAKPSSPANAVCTIPSAVAVATADTTAGQRVGVDIKQAHIDR